MLPFRCKQVSPGMIVLNTHHYSADKVYACEVRLAQISSMSAKGFLSDMIMVEAMTASGVLMGETGISRNLFAILFLFSHAGLTLALRWETIWKDA
jgi:hypothetical protein